MAIKNLNDLSGQDLILQRDARREELIEQLHELGGVATKLGKAEFNYRKEQATLMLKLRAKDTPVTMLSDLCKGDERVGKLRLDRDIARAMYDVARETLFVLKGEIRILENQIEAERRGL